LPPPALTTRRPKLPGLDHISPLNVPLSRTIVLAGTLIVLGLFGIAGLAWKLTAGTDDSPQVQIEDPGDLEFGELKSSL
jgi:hypothetical protein